MFTIRQTATGWELVSGDEVLAAGSYTDCLAQLATLEPRPAQLAAEDGTTDGLLPEVWEGDVGFQEPTGDGRDFTTCEYLSRDVAVSTMPLMFQTVTQPAHWEAELAGYLEQWENRDGTVYNRGRFYDSEPGRALRDALLGGRSFGVSMDPGARTEYRVECLEFDDEMGWCTAEVMHFDVYEQIGLTATPFPGFARASIHLVTAGAEAPAADEGDGGDQADDAEGVAASSGHDHDHGGDGCSCGGTCSSCSSTNHAWAPASAGPLLERARLVHSSAMVAAAAAPAALLSIPVRPRFESFANPMLGELTPFTLAADGHSVHGHLCGWDTCHTGSPAGECVLAPRSRTDYAYFLTGAVPCEDGTLVPTGPLTLASGHADLRLSYRGAMDHYDNSATAVADVNVGEDAHGIWFAGALRPGVTEERLREVYASSLSGDWRPIRGQLEMIAALGVNSPGFPVPRVRARVAAGGQVLALVAAGRPVPRAGSNSAALSAVLARVDALEARLAEPYRATLRDARLARLLARLRATIRG